MPLSKGLTIAAAVLASLAASASALEAGAQDAGGAKRKAQYLGGFRPDECRYPPEHRRNLVSACCVMELDIDATGHVLASEGVCTHKDFLAPTQRCLAVQRFAPATQNGHPVRARQSLEYEWRANSPAPESLCKKLRTS
jgi:hypothetical protein